MFNTFRVWARNKTFFFIPREYKLFQSSAKSGKQFFSFMRPFSNKGKMGIKDFMCSGSNPNIRYFLCIRKQKIDFS